MDIVKKKGQAGKPRLRWRPQIIKLHDTNESPLWQLSRRELNDIEEHLDYEYWETLGYLCGALAIIMLAQDGGPTGLIAVDDEGEIIDLPELEDFADDIEELERSLGGKALGYEIASFLQKKYGRRLAMLVYKQG